MKQVPVLFLDLDGTVCHGKTELGRFVNSPEDVVVFPEAVAHMRCWKERGGRIVSDRRSCRRRRVAGHAPVASAGQDTELGTEDSARRQIPGPGWRYRDGGDADP